MQRVKISKLRKLFIAALREIEENEVKELVRKHTFKILIPPAVKQENTKRKLIPE